MPVNLEAWESTINHLRMRLRSSETQLLTLSEQVVAQNKETNALRDQLRQLEELDKDLTELMVARGEVRS